MPEWAWLSIAVLLAITEVIGGEFVLLALGGAALITAGASTFVEPLWLQVLIFAVSAVLLIFVARPPLLKHLKKTVPGHRTGVDAVIGSPAKVISTVDANGGQVKIGGEIWSALGVDGHRSMPPGTDVTVVEVRGATAVVIWGPR